MLPLLLFVFSCSPNETEQEQIVEEKVAINNLELENLPEPILIKPGTPDVAE